MYKNNTSSVFRIRCHMVLVTKYRKDILNDEISSIIQDSFNLVADKHGIELVAWNYDNELNDHFHIVFDMSPTTCISDFMRAFRGPAARNVFKNFPNLKSKLYGGNFWSKSYFVSSVGNVGDETVLNYVKSQTKNYRTERNKGKFVKNKY